MRYVKLLLPGLVMLPLLVTAQGELEKREAAIPGNELRNAYFGETHVHRSFSLDAFIGGVRLTPFDAYRFAKGDSISINNVQYKIGRPLDFAAVSDHAEFLGEMLSAQFRDAPGLLPFGARRETAIMTPRGENS